jgi:hypothetical protein
VTAEVKHQAKKRKKSLRTLTPAEIELRDNKAKLKSLQIEKQLLEAENEVKKLRSSYETALQEAEQDVRELRQTFESQSSAIAARTAPVTAAAASAVPTPAPEAAGGASTAEAAADPKAVHLDTDFAYVDSENHTWQKWVSAGGKPYYHNVQTGISTWKDPRPVKTEPKGKSSSSRRPKRPVSPAPEAAESSVKPEESKPERDPRSELRGDNLWADPPGRFISWDYTDPSKTRPVRGIVPRNPPEQWELTGGDRCISLAREARLKAIAAGKSFPPSAVFCHARNLYVPKVFDRICDLGEDVPQG